MDTWIGRAFLGAVHDYDDDQWVFRFVNVSTSLGQKHINGNGGGDEKCYARQLGI